MVRSGPHDFRSCGIHVSLLVYMLRIHFDFSNLSIAATAPNMDALIVSSIFIGPASSLSVAYMIYLGELVPIKHRGYWLFIMLLSVIPFQWFAPLIGKQDPSVVWSPLNVD